MMSATVVTAATITADQLAVTNAKAALTVTLSTDAQKLATDRTAMHDKIIDAQLSLKTDTSVFAQTFADDKSAFALKLAADHSVLAADAQLLRSAAPSAAKAQYQSDLRQLKTDTQAAAATVKSHRVQANTTLAHDRASIIAAKVTGQAKLLTDAADARHDKLSAAHAISTVEAKLSADQRTLAATSR